jgi:hypothetical protein
MVASSQTRLASIVEVTYGTTPATPTFLIQRFVSENLNANIENVVSNEIRSDRNITDLIQVGQSAGGSVDFELSYGSFDVWLESLMFAAWATDVLKNGNTQNLSQLKKLLKPVRLINITVSPVALRIQCRLQSRRARLSPGHLTFLRKARRPRKPQLLRRPIRPPIPIPL